MVTKNTKLNELNRIQQLKATLIMKHQQIGRYFRLPGIRNFFSPEIKHAPHYLVQTLDVRSVLKLALLKA